MILKQEAMFNPSIAATTLKWKHPELLMSTSIRTICHCLHKDLGLPVWHAAKKLLLMAIMKKKRLTFTHKYKNWTPEDWKKVMFTDESTFRHIWVTSKTVCCPEAPPGLIPRTPSRPWNIRRVWWFGGHTVVGGSCFLPKNVATNGNIITMRC